MIVCIEPVIDSFNELSVTKGQGHFVYDANIKRIRRIYAEIIACTSDYQANRKLTTQRCGLTGGCHRCKIKGVQNEHLGARIYRPSQTADAYSHDSMETIHDTMRQAHDLVVQAHKEKKKDEAKKWIVELNQKAQKCGFNGPNHVFHELDIFKHNSLTPTVSCVDFYANDFFHLLYNVGQSVPTKSDQIDHSDTEQNGTHDHDINRTD